jgi:ketosteroid isomerase-like protein
MTKRLIPALAILMAILLISSVGFAKDHGKVRAKIDKMNETWMNGVKLGDAAMIASVYTDDAWAMVPNYKTLEGATLIGEEMGGVMDIRLQTLELEVAGDWAYEVGSWEYFEPCGMQADDGKYMIVWMKVGDGWKIHRDIWNSANPVEAADDGHDEHGSHDEHAPHDGHDG